MARKALIPEEKWEGLRQAMEEAAGTRKTSKTPVPPAEAAGETARPERVKKRSAGEKGKEERAGEKEREKKEKKKKKDKKGKKRKKKGKKGKGKKRKGKGKG